MNFRLPKNLLPIILGFMALVIWGHNGIKFFKGIRSADEPSALHPHLLETRMITKTGKDVEFDDWVYEPKFRDPFENWLIVRKKPKKKPRPKKRAQNKKNPSPSLPLPRLRLTGIIKDPSGSLAIIEDTKQEIFFVQRGDTIAGVKIVSVDSTRIDCEYKNQKFTLILR